LSPNLTSPERGEKESSVVGVEVTPTSSDVLIPNHRTARLSDLDMQVVLAVPPGGNWKDVPATVPGKRLARIRKSFAAGEGSRSTYYGRLRADRPSYTVNTYFSRPGNGCHIHYGQDRVLSQREAARLQSFPDSFVFQGAQSAINRQIGNAVPPLLALQIALGLGRPGGFVELFAGAGGQSLGFTWAGWRLIIANDIDRIALRTHSLNVDGPTLVGDIRNPAVFEGLVHQVASARAARPDEPLWVVGGPPCQGFSTAGKARTMADERNHLVWHYRRVLDALQPDGFVFENVTGLLSMDGGRVFQEVRQVLSGNFDAVTWMVLAAEEYGIPQRRSRVIIIGRRNVSAAPAAPVPITVGRAGADLFHSGHAAISVAEALDDLPPLHQGEDGSHLPYVRGAEGPYQQLMRGQLKPMDYLAALQHSV
jgi:DNA (cytosine-5)-methyltransferase 1